MSDANKWKSKLLSSSVPMEYEVARMLVEHEFSVDADYSYSRDDAGVEKDFSVDIRATGYPPYDADNMVGEVQLIVECKHDTEGNKWLFFPDANPPDMSPFTPGDTLRAIDSFSWRFLPGACTAAFDEASIFCMKGVEVDASNGSVHESEIKHGLMQLQYALPRLLKDYINFNIYLSEEENYPFFFCPILLTTSTLLVANQKVSIKAVEERKRIRGFFQPGPLGSCPLGFNA